MARVKLFEPNVKVLTIPTIPGPTGGRTSSCRIETKERGTWAFAADNAQF